MTAHVYARRSCILNLALRLNHSGFCVHKRIRRRGANEIANVEATSEQVTARTLATTSKETPMAFSTDDLEALRRDLAQLLPNRPKSVSNRDAVGELTSELAAAQRRGYGVEDLAQLLCTKGLRMTAGTLKGYLQQGAKEKATAEEGHERQQIPDAGAHGRGEHLRLHGHGGRADGLSLATCRGEFGAERSRKSDAARSRNRERSPGGSTTSSDRAPVLTPPRAGRTAGRRGGRGRRQWSGKHPELVAGPPAVGVGRIGALFSVAAVCGVRLLGVEWSEASTDCHSATLPGASGPKIAERSRGSSLALPTCSRRLLASAFKMLVGAPLTPRSAANLARMQACAEWLVERLGE
jgi:hypothetical protein